MRPLFCCRALLMGLCEEMGKMNVRCGVDLGGTTAKCGLFTPEGEIMEKWELPTQTQEGGSHILSNLAQSLYEHLREKGLAWSDVLGVGMGVPGAVMHESFVAPCVNLNQWGGFDVAERLSALCGDVPVKIVNDANAAALGELSHGGGLGCDNVLFVTLGTGVGGGVIVNGKLVAGPHGAGGEIGHVKVTNDKGRACGCGKSGCLEQYASATGAVRSVLELLKSINVPSSMRPFGDQLTCKDIFDCARAGDAPALRVVEEMGELLGKTLASVACVCDPEVIVVGGGVARAGDLLLKHVRSGFRANAFPAQEETPIVPARLGNDAGMYGAAHLMRGK